MQTGMYKWIIRSLRLFLSYLPHLSLAILGASYAATPADNSNSLHQYITLLYSKNNAVQSDITSNITQLLLQNNMHIVLSEISEQNNKPADGKTGLVIAVGLENIQDANKRFPDTSKLLIASNPGEYSPAEMSAKSALLYMSQPYSRQIHLIKLLNSQWHDFSYLTALDSMIDDAAIQQCARKHGIAAYKVIIAQEEQLTYYLRKALAQSDLILALPDRSIYNSKSVKNILLTSYRDRKPIIAFSRNFVNAGALAAVHSDTGQIAASASALVKQYIQSGGKFDNPVNYPQAFDISINTQVFRALDLQLPDIAEIARLMEEAETDNKGGTR